MDTNPKILLDIEEESPILDFDKYINTACDLIKNSDPRFSIGIYGEWGTGKTTLMKGIEKQLESADNIQTVWFNAWRYENEQHHSTIPLLKTIAYYVEKNNEFKNMSEKFKTATSIIIKGLVDGATSAICNTSSSDMIADFKNKISILAKFEQKTIYYDGLSEISQELKKIKKKIIIFVDDLDRCSPEKTIQVLESMKAFLDIWGIVFVVGLSYNTTANLITKKYANAINGEDYIKKIIQVPLFVQNWNDTDISKMITNLSKSLSVYYKEIIQAKLDMLILVLEKNPREVKRFINSFIISNEIHFKDNKEKSITLLIIKAFKWRWPKEYDLFSKYEEFRKIVNKLFDMKSDQRNDILIQKTTERENKSQDIHSSIHFEDIKQLFSDDDFVSFSKYAKSLFEIEDWEVYRRASSTTDRIQEKSVTLPSKEKIISLLKTNVVEFNNLRIQTKYITLDLQDAYLKNADLLRVFHKRIIQQTVLLHWCIGFILSVFSRTFGTGGFTYHINFACD